MWRAQVCSHVVKSSSVKSLTSAEVPAFRLLDSHHLGDTRKDEMTKCKYKMETLSTEFITVVPMSNVKK